MIAAAAGALVLTGPAQATERLDPTGQDDMLNGFSATVHRDLDIVSVRASYNSATLFLSSTQNGPVGLSPDNLFVWGIDRGKGQDTILTASPNQPSLGHGVKFDAFITFNSTGEGSKDGVFLVDYDADGQVIGATRKRFDRSWLTIDGNTISLAIPLGEIPTSGFDVSQYGLNLWTRSGDTSDTKFIVDFAPNGQEQSPGTNPLFNPSLAVPEPTTWALMIMGFGLAGASLRRRRTATLAV